MLEECAGSNRELAPFLENVIWGTEGALYTLRDCEETLRRLPQARFLMLKESARLLAVRMLIEKYPQRGPHSLHAFYHSMFSVAPSENGKGYGRRLAEATLDILRPRLGPKGLIYSHVETDNHRSLRIHHALGYRPIGKFYAMTFSRLFPRSSARIERLNAEEKGMLIRLLNQRYAEHALTDFAQSLQVDSYFVIRNQGEIVAGVQVLPQRWIIRSLGGPGGFLALKLLPHLPLLRRLINPANFRFLKLSHVYFKEGSSRVAQELVEGILAKEKLCTAMMFWDPRSSMYQEFRSAGPFGILNILTQTPVEIMGLFHNFSEAEIADLARRPACISPIDL